MVMVQNEVGSWLTAKHSETVKNSNVTNVERPAILNYF